jgi:hypothetical protein
MKKMNCEFCNNIFGTKYSLQAHQKRAKYCLNIQQKTNADMVSELMKCDYCNKSFSPHNMERHYSNCKQKLKKRIEELERIITEKDIQIAKLKSGNSIYKEFSEHSRDTIEEIARQPRNQTTNNTQNTLINMTPFDMNNENFSKTIEESFTKEYLLEGQKGVAKFAVDNLLKDENGKLKYVCTDPSRQIYRFKTLDGGLERDVKAKKLTRALADNLTKKSHAISMEELGKGDTEVFVVYTSNFQDIKELHEDNGEFRTELASLTTM